MDDRHSPIPRMAAGQPNTPVALMALPSLAAAFVLAVLVAACAPGAGPRTAPGAAQGALARIDAVTLLAAPKDSGQILREPIMVSTGSNGVLDVVMEATIRDLPVPGSTVDTQRLRTYRLLEANGVSYRDRDLVGYPGPTFRVTQGDSVRIRLINHLPPDDSTHCQVYPASQPRPTLPPADSMINCFHGPNSTNIHYHGFHVSPEPPADAVLMQVAPGDSFQYAFRIPANQAAGTHWYHPHKHGGVATQVTNGMSGAFIVLARHGGLDSLTRARRIREVLVAVQEIDQAVNLVDSVIPRVKLVNGQYKPKIVIGAGEVIRMRLVNENIAASASYSLLFASSTNAPKLYDIARDGVQYAPVNYDTVHDDTKLWVTPGNRLDAFVRAPCVPGTHELQAAVAHPPEEVSRKERSGSDLTEVQTVVSFQVTAPAGGGACTLTQLPPSLPELPDYLDNLAGTTDTTVMPVIVFNDSTPSGRTRANPSTFYLGNFQNPWMQLSNNVFIPTTRTGTRQPMVFGQTQTWMVVNRGTTINHPFHIHINPFQVVSVAYGSGDPNAGFYEILNKASRENNAPIWMDVLPLPKPYVDSAGGTKVTRPGYAVIRQENAPFLNADGCVCQGCGPPTGQFVMHCHILGHEERGMMQIIEIFPTLTAANASDGSVRPVNGQPVHLAPLTGPRTGRGNGAG
ncbi:MAG TPA: multicopper oxidase family protein, partial [Longimicrobium sp.]|nr:multicopper oxidase family protein [Longimicrobium sp.]